MAYGVPGHGRTCCRLGGVAIAHSGRWMFGRIFGLDGRELSRGAAGAVMLPSP